MRLLKFLFSGEFIFAAFLLANVFKSAFPILPVDANIILFAWSFLIAMKRIFVNRSIHRLASIPLLVFGLFLLTTLLSLVHTPSVIYSAEKTLILFSFSLWSFLGVFLLINNKKSLEVFLSSFMLIAVATSIYVLVDYFTSTSTGSFSRIGVDGVNSLGLGRMTALGSMVIISVYLFNSNKTNFKKSLSVIGLGVLILVLMLTGARMALLSLAFVIVLFLALKTFKFTKRDVLLNKGAVKVAFSLIPIPLIMIPFQDSIQTMLTRLTFLFNSSGHGSYSQRAERFSFAFDVWKNNPILGDGFGSYAINYTGIDERYYPHNIILEVLSELGFIGFAIFGALLVLPFFLHNVLKSNHLQVCVLLMFIYTFLNANTTGDINDNRMIFTFLALLYLFPLFSDEKVNELQLEQTKEVIL